jgi:hypothetical protein
MILNIVWRWNNWQHGYNNEAIAAQPDTLSLPQLPAIFVLIPNPDPSHSFLNVPFVQINFTLKCI